MIIIEGDVINFGRNLINIERNMINVGMNVMTMKRNITMSLLPVPKSNCSATLLIQPYYL